MRPANDPAIDYKALVRQGYDRCAAAYDRMRQEESNPELALLTGRLRDGATVLDVGCGAGVPVARSLAQRFAVTGVDISGEMIRRATANVPAARFVQGDIMAVDFPASYFDAAVSFYAILHLPREEHRALFQRIYRWLKPGGYLLATVSALGEPPYTDHFFGVTMYWSNYGLSDYEQMLVDVGFDLLEVGAVGHGYGEAYQGADEHHPLVFAQRRI
jgi:SAM-dependent methyltransferase